MAALIEHFTRPFVSQVKVRFEPLIESHLRAAETAETVCRALVREALDNGAPDNVSVIVVDLVED